MHGNRDVWGCAAVAAVFGTVQHLLVFDGVKMGARIAFDGHLIGNTTDQFRR